MVWPGLVRRARSSHVRIRNRVPTCDCIRCRRCQSWARSIACRLSSQTDGRSVSHTANAVSASDHPPSPPAPYVERVGWAEKASSR
eukprot:7830502-Pyramimonas_sp.AAC.1